MPSNARTADPPPNPPPKGGGLRAARRHIPVKFATHTATKLDIERARRLRREMSKPERILWRKLRELPSDLGFTFRRQHPVHPYILDFACGKIKLGVELDGMSHDNAEAQQKDARRDVYISGKGYIVLRFTNEQLLTDVDAIITNIIYVANHLTSAPHKALPPWGEGWVGGDAKPIYQKN